MGATMGTSGLPGSSGMTGNWWALLLRALLAIVIGLIAFMRPAVTLAALITFFGVFAMADGIFAVVAALRGMRRGDRWGWMLFEGIVGIVAGGIALFNPAIGALALAWLVAGWALATGILEIAAAIKLRKVMTGEWLLLAAGVLSIIFAFIVATRPGVSVLLLVMWIGIFAIIHGFVTMALAFRVRKWSHEHAHAHASTYP